MFSHGFPYTNFHDLNLDWIIKTVKILFNKSVFSINNIEPDDDGNVTITGTELGAIGTVNNIAPVDGNVTLTASDVGAVAQGVGVTKVNGFIPDAQGNVLSGTVRSINGISPTSLPTPGDVVLNASDVGALPSTIDPVETVNGISPDANGNVNVGTVKSVNGSAPDSNGNINLPTISGVTSVDGVGADAQGNVQIDALVKAQTPLINDTYYVNGTSGSDDNTGLTAESAFKTINKAVQMCRTRNIRSNNAAMKIYVATGTYNEHVNITRQTADIEFAIVGDVHIASFRVAYGSHVTIGSGDLYIDKLSNSNSKLLWLIGNAKLTVGKNTNIYINNNNQATNSDTAVTLEEYSELFIQTLTISGTITNFSLVDNSKFYGGTITAPTAVIERISFMSIFNYYNFNNVTPTITTAVNGYQLNKFM